MKMPRRIVVVYCAVLLGIGIASATRSALYPVVGGEHMMFYFVGVCVAAWAGGVRAAMATALFSSVLANYLFSEPRGYLHISNAEQLCSLIVFNVVSLLIGILCEISLKSIARAKAAEQQKDDFLAILAHELRNPLAVIHYTNQAEYGIKSPLGQERSEVIDRQIQQLDQMIEDLVDISRVSRGRFRLEFEPVDVATIVDATMRIVGRQISDRDHELVVEPPPAGLILWCDPLRLQQVLTNLLRNAARYTPRGGGSTFASRLRMGSRCSECVTMGKEFPRRCSVGCLTCGPRLSGRWKHLARGLGLAWLWCERWLSFTAVRWQR